MCKISVYYERGDFKHCIGPIGALVDIGVANGSLYECAAVAVCLYVYMQLLVPASAQWCPI